MFGNVSFSFLCNWNKNFNSQKKDMLTCTYHTSNAWLCRLVISRLVFLIVIIQLWMVNCSGRFIIEWPFSILILLGLGAHSLEFTWSKEISLIPRPCPQDSGTHRLNMSCDWHDNVVRAWPCISMQQWCHMYISVFSPDPFSIAAPHAFNSPISLMW